MDVGSEVASRGRVAVAIVNWNGRHHLAECLPALSRQTYPDHEVVIVDNGSTDGSREWLAREWPSVRVIDARANIGFARANNVAIGASDSEWVALLNNDTMPEPGWLAALVDAATRSGERVGSVASLMLFADDPGVVNSAGIAVDPAGIAWDRLGGASADSACDAAPVFGASAGAALYRRAALLDVAEVPAGDVGLGPDIAPGASEPAGPDPAVRPDSVSGPTAPQAEPPVFDERFFMYLEDVDLAWRLQLRGWRSVYEPDARVLHHGSATSGEGSPFKNRLLARNKVWTVVKDYPTRELLAMLPVVVLYDLASAPYRLLVQGQTAAMLGRVDALRGLPQVLTQRRRVQGRRTAPWAEISRVLEPLEPPWSVLRRYEHLRGRG